MKRLTVIPFILLALLAAGQQRPQKPPVDDERKEEFQEQRQEWFYGLRAFPKDSIPLGARAAGLRQLQKMLRDVRPSSRDAAALSATRWTSIGPRAVNSSGLPYASGRVSALAVDPRNADTVYLGGADGGIWKSVDGGKNWKALTDDQPSLAIGALALDPGNPDVVYAGTGDPNGYTGAGILKSTDGGNTWSNIIGPFADARIGGLAIHPANSQILLAAKTSRTGNNDGIYRSTDGGSTWKQVLTGSGFSVTLSATGIGYAALLSDGTKGGVYKSTDGGVTWNPVNGSGATALPFAASSGIRMAVAPSNPSQVVVSLANSSRKLMGLYKSLDGGATWNALAGWPDYCTPQCNYSNIVAIHPANSNIIYTGGALNTYRTLDGGKTITEAHADNGSAHSDIVHVDEQSYAFSSDGGRFYLGTDGGVVSTSSFDQEAISWTSLNATLTLTQFYPGISIHPSNINIGFGGTQDNSTERYSGSLTWDTVTCGDGGWTAIDYLNPNNVYAACTLTTVMKSTDGGNTFSPVNGIAPGPTAFIAPLVMDPVNPARLYFGTDVLQQTTDGSKTWTPISPSIGPNNPIAAIGISAGDPNTVYAGTQNGKLSVSRNALSGPASTWTDRSKGLPGRTITQISVDPGNPLTAVVSIGGFNANTTAPGHIFRTTDGGATWTDITGSLPDVPADDVVIDPDIPGTIYAATDLGAFYTANNGTLWSVLGAGLPRVAVMGLRLHRQARILRAGTFGRGMWDISVPAPTQNPLPVLSSLAPPISAPGSGAFTLTVNGIGFAAGSVVQWNGSGRATTITGPTSLTAAITAADVAGAGTAIVTVFSPLPGGGTSNGLGFTIGATIAAPTLTAVSPPTVTAGSGDYLLTVSGTGFVSGSTLNWNGSPRPSTPLSATQLGAAISAADIKAAGTISVTVTNPTPGGGVSNPLSEFVTGASASSTFAGAFWSFNGSGVTALNAPLGTVAGLAVDATGNLFVSDMDNCIVFKLAASGTFAPVAGSGNCVAGSDARYRLASPSGLAIDSVGNLYINDVLINRVVRLNGDSTLTRVAGNGFFGYSGDGDAATKASIGQTNASAFDAAGNLYIAETIENRIRKVDKSGNISTFAGSGQQGYSGDGGPATSARLSQPFGVATDAAGNVYIADTFNHVIRKVASNGTITTVAGTNIGLFGGDGGPATKASIALPKGVATDAGGNLYIADTSNNRIRKVDTASGIITTVAGNGAGTFAGDGGPAASASLFAPVSIALDAAGNLYIADGGNKRVRKVASGVISTIAGNGNYKFAGDGGSAASANFNAPQGVLGDRQGNVFVADTGNNRIRKIDAGGTVSTIAGNGLSGFSGDGGPATAASFSAPMALARDLLGNIYVADQLNSRVRRITSGGTISTFAGGGGQSPVNGSTATAVAFNLVNGVASDGVNVFIAAGCGAYMVASDGKITVLANGFPFCQDSGDGGPASTAGISLLAAIGVDGSGNVYLGEYGKVRRIGADGKINTVAGGGPAFNADGSLGAGIRLNSPGGLTVDASGNVFFTDSVNNDRLYLLSPAGNLTTILGGGQGKGFVGLQLAQPHGVTVDAQGNLYVADTGNDRIVKLTGYGAPGAVVVAPTVTAAGIVNGASFATDNVVSPWSIASLFGLNLSTGTGGAATVPLPTNLNGTQLLVNGAAAPLYFTSSGQVNFQIPVEAAGTSGTLAVVSQGATSSTVALKLAPTSPGIFSASPGGTGQGAVLNQDFSANSSANPAARGSVIQIFATGLGATTPPVVTGQAGASSPPFNNTVNSPTVLINGQPAVLQFSAAAPGFVGLYQVNATVPNIPSGTATLQIQSGGRSSNTVTFAVK